MKNNLIEYPHPVLSPGGKDFIDSSFSMTIVSQNDESKDLVFCLQCLIQCEPLRDLIGKGSLKLIVKITCPRTSYRVVERIVDVDDIEITIPKDKVNDTVIIQGLIVSSQNGTEYKLDVFNVNYFGEKIFNLKKGDIVAYAPEIIIKLNTVLEKNIPSIILVSTDPKFKEMKVVYARDDETNEKYQNYITIWLPQDEYLSYEKLRKKKSFKTGIARFLQASLIVPALTEGISKLRMEDREDWDSNEGHYHGTIWADSICEALKENYGIEDLNDCQYSDYELANKLLGDVEGDAIDNLLRKLQDWSTVRQGDDIL